MSKTLIVVVIAAAVIGGGYFAVKSKRMENAPVQNGQNEQAETPQNGKKMAFSELIKQGDSYQCEVKAVSDFDTGGTIYMSGGNLRGDFSTIAEGRTMESSFIMKDGYIYNWSSTAAGMGVKIKATAGAEAQAEGVYSWGPEQVGDYKCAPWTADSSKFTVPSDVKFTLVGPQ